MDLCVLCGCDYTNPIGGMGPVTAYKMLKEAETIEGVIKKVIASNDDPKRKKKYVIPDKFLYEESRQLFISPDVISDKEEIEKMIIFDKPAESELKDWLINQKGFTETKVNNGLERLLKSQKKKNQCRLDNFFKQSTIVSSKKIEEHSKKKTGSEVNISLNIIFQSALIIVSFALITEVHFFGPQNHIFAFIWAPIKSRCH